jgi:Cu(I)/Ag(I) efflux system membrane protein CusA/SilA
LGSFTLLEYYYKSILKWCLDNKVKFLLIPSFLILLGATTWIGFNSIFGFVAKGFEAVSWDIRTTKVWSGLTHTFPGVGKEFMPSLNEGSFLLMPTSMPHSGIEYNRKVVGQLDMLLTNIPEVEMVVGKLGRVESALDPAPISMFENIINYKPEYMLSEKGHRVRFKIDRDDRFILNTGDSLSNEEAINRGVTVEELIADDNGNYFRNWRSQIKSPDDIWNEIVKVTKIPGITSAPKLQPIETRLVMLQTGMRAPMGIKVYGPDLQTIEDFGLQLEEVLKNVPSVKAEAVFADRIVGKPYLHLNIDRDEISRYGLNVEDVQQTIETAIGGMKVTSTVEGRERFPVRVRYPRELRDDPESLGKILIPTPTGAQIPLSQVVDFEYMRGPQAIKSEETFLVGYVLFDKRDGFSEVGVVNDAQAAILTKIDAGDLVVPAGISYKFSGSYENQVRAEKRLSIIVPLVLLIVFLILYFQFKSVTTSLMVFTGIAMAFSGGFLMLWFYGQEWFVNFSIFGTNMRDLFQMGTINLSVAVWVGFIALFGIATDDGVLIATYLDQSFKKNQPDNLKEVRAAVVEAGVRRIRPALMTVSTTMIALLPVLTSTGRGADIMIPMAIPSFGGMAFALVSIFIVPVLYSMREERKFKKIQS